MTRIGCFVLLCLTATAGAASAQPAPDDLKRGYDLVYGGEFAEASRHFERLLAAKPDDLALRFGALMALVERVNEDKVFEPEFERKLDALIDLTDTRYGKNARDGEALNYLAQAYLMRGAYRFEHDKGMWGASRDGAKAKSYGEAYIKAYPDHGDGYLTLGLYNYYVDIIPTFFKMMRFFLFLPAGNRVEGLKQIERAAAQGVLLAPQAQTILVEVYSQFEGRTSDALAMADRLQRRYPSSDPVSRLTGELYLSPAVDDRPRAAAAYQQIIDRRKTDETPDGLRSRFNAILLLANVRFEQARLDDAIALLTPTIEARVAKPDWVLPQFLLRRSNYRALANDPAAAEDARRVEADPTMAPFKAGATSMLKWMSTRPTAEAAVYAALLPGYRLALEGRWEDARKAYDPVRAKYPDQPLVKLRLAQLQFTSGDAEGARPAFAALAAGGKAVGDGIKAMALLYVARADDLAGRREIAKRTYQKIVDDYETQRAANAARLGLLTPYKRPAVTTPAAVAPGPGPRRIARAPAVRRPRRRISRAGA